MTLRVDKNETVLRARRLRRSMTLPEGLLWQALRTRPEGLKFRRQHPLGPFIADFYCASAKLAIEVDGAMHGIEDRAASDFRRDARISERGLRVVRIAAVDVMRDLDAVVRMIVAECRLPLHHPADGSPPQQSWGGS